MNGRRRAAWSVGPEAVRRLWWWPEWFLGSDVGNSRLIRMIRDADADPVMANRSPGALDHLYVVSGGIEVGQVGDTVILGAGDFARYPVDVPHLRRCVTKSAVAHVVTTLPQLHQFDARPS